MNHPLVTRSDVERALRKDTRPVKFEVHYHGRIEPVTYNRIDQINFDRIKKIVLVFPPGSGDEIYVADGEWKTKDRKKVRST